MPWVRSLLPLPNGPVAQSVEHAAVNRGVVGSSPTWGAIKTTVAAADQVAANALFIGR